MSSQVEINIKYQQKKYHRKMFCKCPFLNGVRVQQTKEEKYKNDVFTIFNWFTLFAVVSLTIFSGITQTNVNNWDMTRHCNETKFNKTLIPITKVWAVLTILIMVVTTILMMSVKMIMYNKMTKDVLNIVNYFIGFLLSWDITTILQKLFSYPIPSYYTIKQLQLHYCSKNGTEIIPFSKIGDLDLNARGSFPSFLMCAFCYSTVFLYLFSCISTNVKSVASKLFSLIVPGVITIAYGVLLWKNNENHIEDIFGGSVIGTFMAMYIMKDIFIKNYQFDRITNDVSVNMSKELELIRLNSDKNITGDAGKLNNDCTVNAYPQGVNQFQLALEDSQQDSA